MHVLYFFPSKLTNNKPYLYLSLIICNVSILYVLDCMCISYIIYMIGDTAMLHVDCSTR